MVKCWTWAKTMHWRIDCAFLMSFGSILDHIKALVNEDTLLRTNCCSWCFLGCANWETFVADTKCFWTKLETFFCVPDTICIRNKCCAREQTGKHLCRQQCVSATMCPRLLGPLGSFVLAMDCVLTTAPRIHQLYFITFPDIVKLYTCQLIYDQLINK